MGELTKIEKTKIIIIFFFNRRLIVVDYPRLIAITKISRPAARVAVDDVRRDVVPAAPGADPRVAAPLLHSAGEVRLGVYVRL